MDGKMEKYHVYAQMIMNQIIDMMGNEECVNFIAEEELMEGENFTYFIHALANVVPCMLVSTLAPQMGVANNLQMNHLANTLCFQFMNKKED